MLKQKHFIWLLKVDAFRKHWLRFVYNTTTQPKCSNLCNAFYGLQGWLHAGYLKKRVNSVFAMTIWCFWISYCKYVLLLVQVFAINCPNAEFFAYRVVCVCVWGGTRSHHSGVYSPSEIVLTVACVQIYTSFITVSVTWLCSPLGLELIN